MLLGGDLNADARSPGLQALAARGWIEDATKLHPGVDHLFVRGMRVESPPARGRPSSATCTWTTTCPCASLTMIPSTRW